MIPVIIALGMIAYGMSEDKSKKSVKKMAKGGGLSTEEQIRFDELDEKMNAYLEGKAQVSSKEMSEHAKLKFKRNLTKSPLLRKQVDWESKVERNSESKMAKGGKIYSSDNMFIVKVYDLKDNERYLGEHRFRAKNIFEAKKMLADEIGDDLKEKFGKYLDFELKEAPSLKAKGGNVKNSLKEDDYVWNAVGKKLIVDKVTEDEYYLTSFMQKGSSPFSKKKVDEYIKKGQWTLKPKTKMSKGGKTEEKDLFEYYDEQPISVQKLFAKRKYEPIFNDEYFEDEVLEDLLKDTEKIGYTFEIGADNMPYNLRKK